MVRFTLGYCRGLKSEQQTCRALEALVKQGIIDGFCRVDNGLNDEFLELRGVDWIIVRGQMGFPLQTKSSIMGKISHVKKEYKTPVVISPSPSHALKVAKNIQRLLQAHPALWQKPYYRLYREICAR